MLKKLNAIIYLTGLTLVFATNVNAGVIAGSSFAYGARVNVTIRDYALSPIEGNYYVSSTLPSATWNAPAAGGIYDGVLSQYVPNPHPAMVDPIAGPVQLLATGVSEVFAGSTVEGGLGARNALANTEVSAASINVFSKLFTAPDPPNGFSEFSLGLTMSARNVTSSALVVGGNGPSNAFGTTSISFGTLSIHPNNGIDPFFLVLPSSPAPNTVVDLSSYYGNAVSLILNEQFEIAGNDTLSLAVNAIHLRFNNLSLSGSINGVGINGDFIIGHAESSLTTRPDANQVPEPASLALWALGGAVYLMQRPVRQTGSAFSARRR